MGEQADVFRAMLQRQDPSRSWGFRLQGGAECDQPIKISAVAAGSPANEAGLTPNDHVTEIDGLATLNLTHSQVLEAIRAKQASTMTIAVLRKSSGQLTNRPGQTGSGNEHPSIDLVEQHQQPPEAISSSTIGQQIEICQEEIHQPEPNAHPISFPVTSEVKQEVRTRRDVYYEAQTGNQTIAPETRMLSYRSVNQPQAPPSPRYLPPGPQRTQFEFLTARSRPFVEPPTKRRHTPAAAAASSPPPLPSPTAAAAYVARSSDPGFEPSYEPFAYRSDYSAELQDAYLNEVPQSRTFRMLESVMSNEEPGAGVAALPPPRSAAFERMKHEDRGGQSPRVKVLMSQKYNSPLGMYSPNNVIETFAVQAETALVNLESQRQPNMPEYQPVFASSMHG